MHRRQHPNLVKFRATWGNGPNTTSRKHERLIGFFEFCIGNDWLDRNPALKMKKAEEKRVPTDYFTREEFHGIVDATYAYGDWRGGRDFHYRAERMRALILLMRWSGLAIRDAVALERDKLGADSGNLARAEYANPGLGFSYSFPDNGYVVLENRLDNIDTGDKRAATSGELNYYSGQCIRSLVAATENPLDHDEAKFNPRITIFAADPTCYVPDRRYPDSVGDRTEFDVFGAALVRAFSGSPSWTERQPQYGGASCLGTYSSRSQVPRRPYGWLHSATQDEQVFRPNQSAAVLGDMAL